MLSLVIKDPLDDPCTRGPGYFHSAIRAERIKNKDVIAPFYRLQAGGKIGFLIQR